MRGTGEIGKVKRKVWKGKGGKREKESEGEGNGRLGVSALTRCTGETGRVKVKE